MRRKTLAFIAVVLGSMLLKGQTIKKPLANDKSYFFKRFDASEGSV